jgi:Methyl-accepting chemotaxis protein (MCP) signalling domain
MVLGTAMCFWASGDFAMTIETLGGAAAPTISAANFLWAAFYPLAYVAVMMLMRQEVKKLRLANYLDGVMAALAAAAMFAAFAFQSTLNAAGGSKGSVAINLVYPLGDVLLFGLVLIGIVLLPVERRRPWYLMGAACLVNTSGDISALFPGVVATRFGFVTNAAAWPASLLLLSLAVWQLSSSRPPTTEPDEIKPGFRLSSLAAGSALLVLLVACLYHIDRAALVLATATLVTAGIRFGLSLAQLRRLTEERHQQLEDAARVTTEFSAKVADGASQQSASLRETTRTMDEVRIAVNDTAEKAGNVAERARDSVRVSDEGARAVATIADAMAEIRERVAATANDILTLSERTQQIGDITRTVKQLAERSKLLALNASIEAARAGEHGKSFNVVALEVRTLSERSEEATAQVEKVLGEIRDATSAAVTASNEGTKVVEHGLELTHLAGDVIRSLTDTIREASQAAQDIAASAQQESVGIDQIANSMSHVNRAAEDLNELSSRLASLGATA